MHKSLSVCAIVAALVVGAYAYEMRVSRVNTWELDFSSKPPRVMELAEDGGLAEYTYVVYEVTNKTEEDISFHPTFEIETELSEKAYRSGVYPKIYELLRTRLGEELLSFSKIIGVISPGKTKKGVAVFKGVDAGADELSVYVTGLNGDLKRTTNAEGEVEVQYRAYKLIYKRPGDEFVASLDPVILKGTDWIWR